MSTRRGAVRTWATDLRIGLRLAAGGGRSTWPRLLLTAVGVGLGVALLLLAASMPGMIPAHRQHGAARTFDSAPHGEHPANAALLAQRDSGYRDIQVQGLYVQPRGAHPPTPPGLDRFPAPGELVVSPALRDLLASDDGVLLRQRLPGRIVGTIGDEGLGGPREYVFYQGTDKLSGPWANQATTVTRWSTGHLPDPPMDPTLMLLSVVGVTVLLLPVAVFIAAAVRFGAESHDRQHAQLRLMGADRWMTRRIAAGEALLGALLGLVLGVAFFLAGRQLARFVDFGGSSVFPADLRPEPLLAALVVIGVPLAAVLITPLALRRVTTDPLGVARRAGRRRRRLWWRPLPALAGVALLLTVRGARSADDNVVIVAGVLLLLGSAASLLPWLVDALVRRAPGRTVASQLAVRRLAADPGSMSRAVGGTTIAVAGAIAIQTVLSGVTGSYVTNTGQDPTRAQLHVETATAGQASRVAAALAATPDVRHVLSYRASAVGLPHGKYIWSVRVADCATLRQIARIDRCADGDSFQAVDDRAVEPGSTLRRYDAETGEGSAWRVPDDVRRVPGRPDPTGNSYSGLLLTPHAAGASAFTATASTIMVQVDEHRADSMDRVRNVVVRVSPMAQLMSLAATDVDSTFVTIRRGLLAGASAVLLLIGASLLLSVLEQLRERRRPLAVLRAFGAGRGVLARSILWQATIPVLFGMALSLAAGAGLGVLLLRLVDQPLGFDWSGALAMVGVSGAVVLLVTVLSMPALYRVMRPEQMRTE